ncbi:MAG TPA: hypothetical protein VER33_00280 [Polyangiaceae bacterium]|nr:hypothetical protein [Polyangiaceae bacterium]
MSLRDHLQRSDAASESPSADEAPQRSPGAGSDDSLRRYRSMVQTASTEAVERAHAEAFSRLGPEQRRATLAALQTHAAEQAGALSSDPTDEPTSLAQLCTRLEARDPGVLERALGAGASTSGLLAALASAALGTAPAHAFFSSSQGAPGDPRAGGARAAAAKADAAEVDFSEEFGSSQQEERYAGGEGFHKEDFDKVV